MSAPTRPAGTSPASTTVTASGGDPLAEAVELTRRLKLPHIRRHLLELVPTARAQRWDHAELVRVLLAEEAAGRDAANLRTRRARAGFPAGKTLGDWDAAASCIPRPTQDALASLEWVTRRENLCVCGPSGTGKSHFCEALGQAAVEAGMTVAWFTIEDLGALVRRHRADDSITRALARLIRTDLIIIDDIGLLPVSPDAAEGLYRLVDAAYERRLVAVTSNLHPSGFDTIMPKTLATATVDRLLHHAHIVATKGTQTVLG
jgi:DNA replication protein DnaC